MQEAIPQRFPADARIGRSLVFGQPAAQQFEQGWVFLLLEDDLVEEFLGEHFLLLGRQREHVGKSINNHDRRE